MKRTILALAIAYTLAFLLLSEIASAQSIMIGPLPTTQFCSNDPISVSFTASGPFAPNNVFTLQLSDATGSFATSFSNIGSLKNATGGALSITTALPAGIISSDRYRLRFISSAPSGTSADNGNDLIIGSVPGLMRLTSWEPVRIGTRVIATATCELIDNTDSMVWDFGPDATPSLVTGQCTSSLEARTTYSAGGKKSIHLRILSLAGCSRQLDYSTYVFDCRSPVIPPTALVIAADTTIWSWGHTLWVNPGVTLTMQDEGPDTIFAEAGSTVTGATGSVVYLKSGAGMNTGTNPLAGVNVAIFATGASVQTTTGFTNYLLSCPSLDFDYSHAPANKGMFPATVKHNDVTAPIEIAPNPTSGMLMLRGIPEEVQRVSVLNVLGATMRRVDNPHAASLEFDLSNLVSGTYYVRFEAVNSVMTKKIVKR